MKNYRPARLTSGHGKSVSSLVGDLRPCLVNETAGTEIDDGPESRHCCADGEAAKSQLGDRRRNHSFAIFIAQVLE